jgi:hypothetical protein
MMPRRPKRPTVEKLREWLRYEDGRLIWQERPRSDFATELTWATWNERHVGTEAGYAGKGPRPTRRIASGHNGMAFQRPAAVWALHHGAWPKRVWHRSQDSLDDRIENLRITRWET